MADFDAIVIGSGFGGAITACRLAEAGYKVLVLERGRRWEAHTYPREATDPWTWDNNAPQLFNGWFDLRMFKNMSVIQGAGVGGGSLVYANISIRAKKKTFDDGWPQEITYDELGDGYDKVGKMLNVRPVPERQWPERTKLMKEAAERIGFADRFEPLELAVSFDDDWHYGLPNPHSHTRSKTFTNAQGQEQGTCVHLGYCDIGCDVKARNTLDLTYLPVAEQHGADIRPLHLVHGISRDGSDYRVHFNRIESPNLIPGSATARLVILGAGSLGSTELLLRCREQGTLTHLSSQLGRGWSSNGDFLTPAIHPNRQVNATAGPTITCAIDLLEGQVDGQDIYIEDGGLPDIVDGALWRLSQNPNTNEFVRMVALSVRPLLTANNLGEHVMPWFAQARDAGDGVLSLKKNPVTNKTVLDLAWDIDASLRTMNAVVSTHQRLALATGGMPLTPFTWTILQDLITPHPLGGCGIGNTTADGVVSHTGEVFGHPNLFVADGAIVPKSIGLNPSRTIGALAERIAKLIVDAGR
jgi:cholesterol oxidase